MVGVGGNGDVGAGEVGKGGGNDSGEGFFFFLTGGVVNTTEGLKIPGLVIDPPALPINPGPWDLATPPPNLAIAS